MSKLRKLSVAFLVAMAGAFGCYEWQERRATGCLNEKSALEAYEAAEMGVDAIEKQKRRVKLACGE